MVRKEVQATVQLLPALPLGAGRQQHGFVDARGLDAQHVAPAVVGQVGQLGAELRTGVPDHGFGAAGALRDLERARGLHQAQRLGGRGVDAVEFGVEAQRRRHVHMAVVAHRVPAVGALQALQRAPGRCRRRAGRCAARRRRTRARAPVLSTVERDAQAPRRQRHRQARRERHAARSRGSRRCRAATAPVRPSTPARARRCHGRLRAKPCLGRGPRWLNCGKQTGTPPRIALWPSIKRLRAQVEALDAAAGPGQHVRAMQRDDAASPSGAPGAGPAGRGNRVAWMGMAPF